MSVTLTQAREHLSAWLAADLAVAQSQEYRIGGMTLTRADAGTIAERIAYWRSEVTRLEAVAAGRSGRIRRYRIIARDT